MAKRAAKRSRKTAKRPKKTAKKKTVKPKRPVKRSVKRQKSRRKSTPGPRRAAVTPAKAPHIERLRRTLSEEVDATIQTPPSSLNLDRRGTAVRSGRAGMRHALKERGEDMTSVTAGDVDVDAQDAYFTGEEAPGGDNPTPGSDVVDEIGKALGVQYDDAEELKSGEKLEKRDKHRWELDPASAEDYKDREK